MSESKEMIQPPRNELGTKPSHHYIQHATSDNTRQAYQADIRHFMAWGGLLIIQQGRWKHEGTVLGYIEEGKRFEGNVVSTMNAQ